MILLGQGKGLHPRNFSTLGPKQGSPPNLAFGESHSRVRCIVPKPHVCEHSLNSPHCPQFPCTEMR